MDSRMDTLSDAMDRLVAEGYDEQFRADGESLVALNAERKFSPEELVVDKVVRFEGSTDVADESAIFALSSRDQKIRGTYVVAFGAAMDPRDARIVPQLEDAEEQE